MGAHGWMEEEAEERRAFTDPLPKARRYQLEVLQKALEENIIVFLETGCGKTLIAVLLISKLSILFRRPSRKLAVFLVPNRALVEQQAKEIEEHSDLYVGRFCGTMIGHESWSHEWWQDQILKYEVMVMTPQILLNTLHHCLLKMDMIELLIFDECHHAQGTHPYASIMRDFYHEKQQSRPKIFGLTASPVKRRVGGAEVTRKMDDCIKTLESIMDAKLYVLKDREELERLLPNPTQHIREYGPSNASGLTSLLDRILRKITTSWNASHCDLMLDPMAPSKEQDDLFKVYRSLTYCAEELGLWCTMEAINLLLNSQKQSEGSKPASAGPMEAFLREAISELRAADPTGQTAKCGASGGGARLHVDQALLSPKLWSTVEIIKEYSERYAKCIVFVDRKVATSALSNALNRFECLPLVRSLPLVGSNSMTQKSQQVAIEKFRSGEANMLVATEVAEEGLDIQSCSMVIRFDGAPKTSRSLIQSRGRARQRGSLYIILVESGNQRQLEDVRQLEEQEELMWSRARSHPPQSAGPAGEEVGSAQEEGELEQFKVECTGATVTTDYSVQLLYHYCSKLHEDEPILEFNFVEDSFGVACEITLPATAAIRVVRGQPCQAPKLARKVAALKACRELHELGGLTDYLLPAKLEEEESMLHIEAPKGLPDVQDPIAQVELHPTLVPRAFQGQWGVTTRPTFLAAYEVSVTAEPKDREYEEFALFLESDLDESVKSTIIDLHIDKGRLVRLSLVPRGRVQFDPDQLRDAKLFQQRIFTLVLDRQESASSPTAAPPWWDSQCFYLTLPILPSSSPLLPPAVDWRSVRLLTTDVSSSPLVGLTVEPIAEGPTGHFQMANGTFSVDEVLHSLVKTVHTTTLYLVQGVYWHMDGNSPWGHEPSQFRSYADYFKKRHKRELMHPTQLLLKARPLRNVRSYLVDRQKNGTGSAAKVESFVELPPELCELKVCGLSSKMVNTAGLLPSLMRRLEHLCLAAQLQTAIGEAETAVSLTTISSALTTAKASEALDLERLELLGDSFLKFAVSRRLFQAHEKKDEGGLTALRTASISNVALHRLAVAKSIPMYINDELFNPDLWIAPGRPAPTPCGARPCAKVHPHQDGSRPGQIRCLQRHRWLQKKVVADVAEALIGAHLVDGGPRCAVAFMRWLGFDCGSDNDYTSDTFPPFSKDLPCADEIRLRQLPSDSWTSNRPPVGLQSDSTQLELNSCFASAEGADLSQLEAILRYTFRDKAVLVEAVTHPSCRASSGVCYQRLEFLGDAVLDYLITTHLYQAFPLLAPGVLTDLRAATACNEAFARVAVRKGLWLFLRHDDNTLGKRLAAFVDYLRRVQDGRELFYGWEVDKSPKALGDLVESLAGAVFVDSQFQESKVWAVFEPLLAPIVTPDNLHLHPVAELTELCAIQKFGLQYSSDAKGAKMRRVVCLVDLTGGAVGPAHGEANILETWAEKKDKMSAQRLAAYRMLEKLKGMGYQHPYKAVARSLPSEGNMKSANKAAADSTVRCQANGAGIPEEEADSPSDSSEDEQGEATTTFVIRDVHLEKEQSSMVEPTMTVDVLASLQHLHCGNEPTDPVLGKDESIGPPESLNSGNEPTSAGLDKENSVDRLSEYSTLQRRPEICELPEYSPMQAMSELEKLYEYFQMQRHSAQDRFSVASQMQSGSEEEIFRECAQVKRSEMGRFSEDSQVQAVSGEGRFSEDSQRQTLAEEGIFSEDSHVQTVSEVGRLEELARLANLLKSAKVSEEGMQPKLWEESFSGRAMAGAYGERRGREELHDLCAKYHWNMPTYRPLPDYPRGPPHSRRFAYVVEVTCFLQQKGRIREYEIQCEGDEMKATRPAMDSAAAFAVSWLQEWSLRGLTFVESKEKR